MSHPRGGRWPQTADLDPQYAPHRSHNHCSTISTPAARLLFPCNVGRHRLPGMASQAAASGGSSEVHSAAQEVERCLEEYNSLVSQQQEAAASLQELLQGGTGSVREKAKNRTLAWRRLTPKRKHDRRLG